MVSVCGGRGDLCEEFGFVVVFGFDESVELVL